MEVASIRLQGVFEGKVRHDEPGLGFAELGPTTVPQNGFGQGTHLLVLEGRKGPAHEVPRFSPSARGVQEP